MKRDPYVILGVDIFSTDQEIKKAYRKLCKKHHPDVGGDPEKFKEIQWAWEVLSDPKKRQAWAMGGDPDKIEPQAHISEVVKVIMELVPRIDLKLDNLIDGARQTLGRMKDKAIERIGDLTLEVGKLRDAAGRVSCFTQENVVAGVLNSTADKMEQEIKLGEAEVEKLVKALAFLDDYSYKTDERENRYGISKFKFGLGAGYSV